MKRHLVSAVAGLVLWAGLAGILGCWTAGAAAPPQQESLMAQAEQAFKLQSYRQAIAKAREHLKTAPPAADSARSHRLIGISQVRLREFANGRATLTELLQKAPVYGRDAEVLTSLAQAALHSNAPPLETAQWFDRAIAQYAAQQDRRQQLDLIFQLADYLRSRIYRLRPGPPDAPPQFQRLAAVALVLKTFDRALAVGGDVADQVRALQSKAQVLLQFGYELRQAPREQWPAFLQTEYDLAKPFEQAIAFHEEIIRRFPEHAAAVAALQDIGDIHANYRQDYRTAVKTYEELLRRHPRTPQARTARERIASIKAPQLSIGVEGVTLPGEKPRFSWKARNIATIDLAAYPVDLFDVLRHVEHLHEIGRYPIERLVSVAKWQIATGDRGGHLPTASGANPATAPFDTSNAYLLHATGANPEGQKVSARALVIVSRLGMMVKTGRQKALACTMDAIDGNPKAGTELLIQQFVRQIRIPLLNTYRDVFEYQQQRAPDSGLAEIELKPQSGESWSRRLLLVARHGNDYALSDAGYYWHWWGYRPGYRVYLYTDRPVYRPEQTVHFKEIVRKYDKGEYFAVVNQQFRVRINDPRGNTVYEKDLMTNELGTLSGSMVLGPKPTLGMYHLTITDIAGGAVELGPGSQFRVEEYKKPEFEVTLATPKPTYKLGEPLRVTVHGEYYFGGPVADADVQYTVHRQSRAYFPIWRGHFDWFYDAGDHALPYPGRGGFAPPWFRPPRTDLVKQGKLKTDALGNAVIELPTEPFPNSPDEDVEYKFDVQMVDQSRREIRTSQTIKVTHSSLYLSIRPQRYLYQPGDRVRLTVRGENANGQPAAFTGQAVISFVTVREQRDESGKIKTPEEKHELERRELSVSAGGTADFVFTAERAGYYRIDVATPDPYGGTATATEYLWVAKGSGEFAHYARHDLEMVLESDTFTAGQTLRLLLQSRHRQAYVLLTAEADDLYFQRVVFVPETQTTVELPIPKSFAPNVTLKAALFRNNQIHEEERKLKVPPIESFLTVKLQSAKRDYRPRESATVEVEVTDHRGQPVAAEVSLGCVDASVFYIQPETRGDVRKFYFGRQRPMLVRTTSSYAFRFWAFGRRDTFRGVAAGLGGAVDAAAPMPEAPMEARRAAVKSEAKAADKADALPPPEIRSEFPDTVFWAAHLQTGTDGKARATIRMPDSLTTWRLTGIAATKETAVGEAIHEVLTKKNVIVRLQAPRFFVERDEVVLSAIAHNNLGTAKTVRVGLETTAELALATAPEIDVEIPAGGEQRVDFSAKVLRPGKVRIRAKALTDVESDAVQMDYPVLEYGTEKLLAQSGVLFEAGTQNEQTLRLVIPRELRPGSQRLVVQVSPTIAGVLLASLPYLLEYPYGCTEQTLSRFVPAAVVANTLRKLDVDLADLAKLPDADPIAAGRLKRLRTNPVYDKKVLDDIVAKGLARLADFQHADGGWGWWKNDASNPYLSAYVVWGLATARDAGVKLPAHRIERGVEFLAQQVIRPEPVTRYPWQSQENVSVRTYMLYALAVAERPRLRQPEIAWQLREAYRKRDELNDYSRALLALSLHAAELHEEAEIVLDNIKDRARVDDTTASWGDYQAYYYWYQAGTEATSFSLRALLAIEPNSPLIPKVVQWLVRHRQGTRWFNTKDTAIAASALADYLQRTGELDPDLAIEVAIAGGPTKKVRVTRQNLFTFDDELELAGETLGTGEKLVTIRRQGRGNLYFGAYATFFTKEESIEAAGNELFVARRYWLLIPHEVEKVRKVFDRKTRKQIDEKYRAIEYERRPLTDGAALASGALVEVELTVDARNNFEYLLFEDPKPAGCEAVELQSGYAWGDGLGAHMELRDEKVTFFATYLNQGKYPIRYRLRAEVPGIFHALPARAECMYTPRVQGNSTSRVVKITHAKP